MMSDNYPFDREHVLVSVDFPVGEIHQKEVLFAKVRELADRRGGRDAGSSEPIEVMRGNPGFATFGMSVAFAAGDINIDAFINWVKRDLKDSGVAVQYDEDDVMSPEMDDIASMGCR